MTSLLDALKNKLMTVLDPQYSRKQTELAYLREVYGNAPGGSKRDQWYRVANAVGDLVGFAFVCTCGQEYQLLSVNDWLGRDYHCPQCKTEFSLMKACGITPDTPVAKWPEFYATLPVRPRLAGTQQPRMLDTWAAGDRETVVWDGQPPVTGVKFA